ncbi:MAG: hypothetical protein U0K95_02655, partial [Eubacterium sp.]|nr:hypothetical protein [Eubacterium sp.]
MSSFMETIKKIELILKGYTYNSASQYIKYKKMTGKISDFDKKILFSYPINGINTRIYDDFYSAKKFIEDKNKKFDAVYCIKTRYGYCLQNNEIVNDDFIVELIKDKGILVRDTFNSLMTQIFKVEYVDNQYFINGKTKTEEEIRKFIGKTKVGRLVLENSKISEEVKALTGFEYPLLHVPVYRYRDEYVIDDLYFAEHMEGGKIKLYSKKVKAADKEMSYAKEAVKIAENIASTYKGTEYINVAFKVLDGELRIDHIDTGLDLLFYRNNREKEGDLFEKIQKKGFFKRIKDYAFSVIAKKKGFLDYMYAYWLRDLKSDFFHSDTPLSKKIWANRRGFYSYRIEQYGLTKENYKNFLSDYDYKRIRPLNLNYAKWLTDKITTYYMLVKDYGQFLAKHYYII